jgi:hypothetical protein
MSFFPKLKMGREDLLAIGGFLALVLVFFYRFLDGSVIIAFKDLSRYFYPLRYLMVEQVRSGHLPLWNPYIFCGFPLLATLQIGFFYPLTVIHYLLPFNLAFNYYTILHYFLAACFMYALLRHYQLTRVASFFGGIVFAFSGYLLSVSNMNTSLTSVVWLPLLLLVWDKLIGNLRLNVAVSLSILLALMFLGGEPTILYCALWLLVIYALIFSPKRIISIIFLAAAGILAAGLVAVQLFPFLELAGLSDRVVITQFDMVSFRSFPPRELLTFIFPYFFGNPAQFGGYTEVLLGKTYQDWLISAYLGIFPLVLIFFSFRRKRSGFFLAAAAVSLLLAFGKYTPIYRLAYQFIPGISMIRFPVKFLFMTTFCLTILSATGFDELLANFSDLKERLRKALVWLIPMFGILLIISLVGYFFTTRIFALLSHKYSKDVPKVFFDLLEQMVRFNLQSLYNLASFLLVLIVLFWLARRGLIKKSIFIGVILLVTVADLFSNGASIAVGAAKEVFSTVPENFAILLKDKSLYRVYYPPSMENENLVIYGENFSAALLNAKDNFAADWHIPYHFYDFLGYESVKPLKLSWLRGNKFTQDKFAKNFDELSSYNVKYVVSLDKLLSPSLKLLRRKDKYGRQVFLYENLKERPRAYLLNAPGKVIISSYRPGKITLQVTAESAGLLFLSEANYPGWKFIVDGKRVKFDKPRAIFSSVEIPSGSHRVEYIYDPLSLKIGAIISTFCLLLTAYGLIKWRAG